MTLFACLLLLGTGGDWSLPPLVSKGLPDPQALEYRYHAHWAVELRLEVDAPESMSVELSREGLYESVKPAGPRVGELQVFRIQLQPADRVRVRLNLPPGLPRPAVTLEVTESPTFEDWVASQPLEPPGMPSASAAEALKLARSLLDVAREQVGEQQLDKGRETLRRSLNALKDQEEGPIDEVRQFLEDARPVAYSLSDLESGVTISESLLAYFRRTVPPTDARLILAVTNAGASRGELQDHHRAVELKEELLFIRERTCREQDLELQAARMGLGVGLAELGDFDTALSLLDPALRAMESLLPEDHRMLQQIRTNVAGASRSRGDIRRAHELYLQVLEVRERTCSENDLSLQHARANAARTAGELGDHRGARRMFEEVLSAYRTKLPEEHPDVLRVRASLVRILMVLGHFDQALLEIREILEIQERSLPEDHPNLNATRLNLSTLLHNRGDLYGAQELLLRVIAVWKRDLPENHPWTLMARGNLASVARSLGDLPRSRMLLESVLSSYEKIYPADHPERLDTQTQLSDTLSDLGEHDEAFALRSQALKTWEGSLDRSDLRLIRLRLRLAATLSLQGKQEQALDLAASTVEQFEDDFPENHPDGARARLLLSRLLARSGDLEQARDLAERVLTSREETLPPDHPQCQTVLEHLTRTLARLGDRTLLEERLRQLESGLSARLDTLPALSQREMLEALSTLDTGISTLLTLGPACTSSHLDRAVFLLVERVRAASTSSYAASLSSGSRDLLDLRAEAVECRSRVNDLVAGLTRAGSDEESTIEAIWKAVEERDRVETSLASALRSRQGPPVDLSPKALGQALGKNELAVAYRRYWHFDTVSAEFSPHLAAHVVTDQGSLRKILLGPLEQVTRRVREYRSIVTKKLSGDATDPRDRLDLLGTELRRLVLDPVVDTARVDRLYVVRDDCLHLLPLDALPSRSGGLLGERIEIRTLPSLAALTSPRAAPDGPPSLLAVGALEYDLENTIPSSVLTRARPAQDQLFLSPPMLRTRAGLLRKPFQSLPQTGREVEQVADLFQVQFQEQASLLTGPAATRPALREQVVGIRFLHLATHGYFCDESIPSVIPDSDQRSFAPMSTDFGLRGLAPMALCGVALSGANAGADSSGRVSGILTAEELTTLDLTGCELAVLSVCQSDAGVRRTGQGVQSLQAAMHEAGARYVLASLWPVNDRFARELIVEFYRGLWVEQKSTFRALWDAKMTLRQKRVGIEHWAGWTLSSSTR